MRKIMIRNTLLMLLVTAVFSSALLLYLRSASSLTTGEVTTTEGTRYTASAAGFASDVIVNASFADGILVGVGVDASGETPEYGGEAAAELAGLILTNGGTSGVDAVAGATITSEAVFAAFADCAAQAGVVLGDNYTATVAGFCSDVVVTATYSEGALVGLTADASGETPEYGGAAAGELCAAILAAGGTDGVDAVAGATITSEAIFEAVADCATQAADSEEEEEIILTIAEVVVTAGDDIYTASAAGYSSDITVSLSYAEGSITSVAINAAGETAEIGVVAANELTEAIAIAGSANGVDAVAGATVTSNAILAATLYIEEAVLLSESTLYQASAIGYNKEDALVLTAAYQDGILVWLDIDASKETPKLGGVTAATLTAEILTAGNADSVDIDLYAGSTETADAVLEAYAACEAMIGSPSNLVTVTSSVVGYNEQKVPIVLTATYANGVLSALRVDASAETPKLGGVTADAIVAEILAAGNADGVDIDAYAGSTKTADAVLEAYAACEAQVG